MVIDQWELDAGPYVCRANPYANINYGRCSETENGIYALSQSAGYIRNVAEPARLCSSDVAEPAWLCSSDVAEPGSQL